jgi:hypothetical protein
MLSHAGGHNAGMPRLPSPTTAERNQRRKLQYVPSMWWLLAIVAVIAVVVLVTR